MIYDWYKIFNLTEFEALDLISKKYQVVLKDIGAKEILVTKAGLVSMIYDDVFLSINLNNRNPFTFEERAVYVDDNDDVWLGIAVED